MGEAKQENFYESVYESVRDVRICTRCGNLHAICEYQKKNPR